MNDLNQEVSTKVEFIRQTLTETESQGLRLRGTDWFAWATGGGSNTVLLAAETGVAEVLITKQDAWILTDEIEAQRLQDEELPGNFKVYAHPWADAAARESFVRDVTSSGKVLSDRPTADLEKALPASLQRRKRIMMSSELERYRQVGRKASEAMTEVLKAAKPAWTEYQLAGAGAEALWTRGLHPALTLVASMKDVYPYTAMLQPLVNKLDGKQCWSSVLGDMDCMRISRDLSVLVSFLLNIPNYTIKSAKLKPKY